MPLRARGKKGCRTIRCHLCSLHDRKSESFRRLKTEKHLCPLRPWIWLQISLFSGHFVFLRFTPSGLPSLVAALNTVGCSDFCCFRMTDNCNKTHPHIFISMKCHTKQLRSFQSLSFYLAKPVKQINKCPISLSKVPISKILIKHEFLLECQDNTCACK